MSTTVTSQPQYSNFSYSESTVGAPPPEAPLYTDPGYPPPPLSAAILDNLSPLPEIFLKHVLHYKDPNQTAFLPSEYHVMTSDGQTLFVGKEENNPSGFLRIYNSFHVRFFNMAGHEVMAFSKDTGLLNPCKAEQRQPICQMTSQGRSLGKVNQRRLACCGDVDFVYEDEYGTESPYSVTVINGSIVNMSGVYEIVENGSATGGTVEAGVYEMLRGGGKNRHHRSMVNYRIKFPPSMRDAKQKAAIMAGMVRMDFEFYCSPYHRYNGRYDTIRLFGGPSRVAPNPY